LVKPVFGAVGLPEELDAVLPLGVVGTLVGSASAGKLDREALGRTLGKVFLVCLGLVLCGLWFLGLGVLGDRLGLGIRGTLVLGFELPLALVTTPALVFLLLRVAKNQGSARNLSSSGPEA
jgi:hypothetical protein